MVVKRTLRNSKAGPPAAQIPQVQPCALCTRPVWPANWSDEHHLVPRSKGGRDKTLIHRICHTKIHATLSENELARQYFTWAALQTHPDIAAFIRWVANKPPEFLMRNRGSRRNKN